MNKGKFNKEDLELCDWQYQIIHKFIGNFKIGEYVFLKSNLEFPIKVSFFLKNNEIVCIWKDKVGVSQMDKFLPECLLQYKYSGLLISKDNRFKICLN